MASSIRSPSERHQLLALVRHVGIPHCYEPGRKEEWFGWDGVALNLAYAHTSSLVHEVAHWLVAEPSRRSLADFGLSEFAEVPPAIAPGLARMEDEPSQNEEMAASLLGILLERRLRMRWQATWHEHSWDESGWGVRECLRGLQRAGFLYGLTPACLLYIPRPAEPTRWSLRAHQ